MSPHRLIQCEGERHYKCKEASRHRQLLAVRPVLLLLISSGAHTSVISIKSAINGLLAISRILPLRRSIQRILYRVSSDRQDCHSHDLGPRMTEGFADSTSTASWSLRCVSAKLLRRMHWFWKKQSRAVQLGIMKAQRLWSRKHDHRKTLGYEAGT